MSWDVVIAGYRLNAREPAAKALERILRLTPEVARKLARSFPTTVLSGASEADADQLVEQLRAAGAVVELRESVAAKGAAAVDAVFAEGSARADAGAVQALPAARGSWTAAAPLPRPRASAPTREPQPAKLLLGQHEVTVPVAAPSPSEPGHDSPGYQLGDFGLERPPEASGQSHGALPPVSEQDMSLGRSFDLEDMRAVHSFAGAEASGGGSFDLDLELSGAALELAGPSDTAGSIDLDDGVPPPAADLHALGQRFEEAGPAPQRAPEVEPRAYRAVQQRAPRPQAHISSRPKPASTHLGSAASKVLRAWLPSLLLLALLAFSSLFAVGYALDPSDALGAFSRQAGRAPQLQPQAEDDASLHPLLAATPGPARSPLAAILRARIAGVHDVPVSFEPRPDRSAQCVLVAHEEGQTEQRLSAVKATGHVVAPPREIAAQLGVQARALAATMGRTPGSFTPVCLAL